MGSPGYMAPERFSLEDHHEGDVYSLGIVAWECLMRRRFGRVSPRQGKHDVQIAGALQQLAATPGLPPDGMQLIRECLRFDPKERPSARDVERRARAVARQAGGELLADWAERIAPLALKPLAAVGPDEDAILHDPTGTIQLGDLGMTVFEAAPPTPQPTSTPTWVAGLWAGALALMVLTLVGVGGLVDALRPESPAAQAPTQEPEALGVIAEPEVIAEPASVDTPTTRSRPSRAQTRPPAVAPKPLVEAEPEVQTEPEVEAATEPAPNPALRPTRVLASGDAVWIRLVRNGQLHAVPATLPAGTYEVMARFPEQEPEGYMTVQLEGQGQVVIHCTSAFRTCQLN